MRKTFLLYKIIFLITVLFLSKSSYSDYADRTIATPHFIINYNTNISSYAVMLSSELESCNNQISVFFETDMLERVHVFITEGNAKAVTAEELNSKYNKIYISSSENFNDVKSEIYRKIFLIHLRKIIQNENLTSVIDESFIDAILQYTLSDKHFINTILFDLVNNEQINTADTDKIKKLNKEQQQGIYTAFIDFVISGYGKKILIQSLKDCGYYNGVFNSISMITGDSIPVISEKFTSWLLKHKSTNTIEQRNGKITIHKDDGFIDCLYSLSEDEQSAVIQIKNGKSRIIFKNGLEEQIISLKNTESTSYFSDIDFINNNQLIIIEVLQNGSSILLYDILQKKFHQKVLLPFLFITHASTFNNESLIFSAVCGKESNIYTFNMTNSEFNILTESGNNHMPLMLNNKAYFVSSGDNNKITEMDATTGKIKTLFSTDSKISDLNRVDDDTVIFSMHISNQDSIYTMNVNSNALKKISINNLSIMKPEISGKHIYFFSFYKSRYKLFSTEYSGEGI